LLSQPLIMHAVRSVVMLCSVSVGFGDTWTTHRGTRQRKDWSQGGVSADGPVTEGGVSRRNSHRETRQQWDQRDRGDGCHAGRLLDE
jgi:hypothetical protein